MEFKRRTIEMDDDTFLLLKVVTAKANCSRGEVLRGAFKIVTAALDQLAEEYELNTSDATGHMKLSREFLGISNG